MCSKEDTTVVDVKTERVEKPRGDGVNRDIVTGKFLPNNCANKNGNPLAKRIHEYREAIIAATTKERLLEVWAVLEKHALNGEAWAVKEYFDRLLGKESAAIIMQQLNVNGVELIKIIKGIDQDRL